MLLELLVKNLALIETAHVEFGEGLNILTGETGAGKSVLIGSINMALGAKASKDSIRKGADSAYVELLFSVNEPGVKEALVAKGVRLEESEPLIISRRILPGRSVSKINDETVTTGKLKEITALLLDIHGQHEHQSLMQLNKHLEILDNYARQHIAGLKAETAAAYAAYKESRSRLEAMNSPREERLREIDFLQFEIESIESAGLKDGEEEELSGEYKRLSHAKVILEQLQTVYESLGEESISRGVRALETVVSYDERLTSLRDQLYDIEALIQETGHSIRRYMEENTCEDHVLREMEARLDLIRGLQARYGNSIARIFAVLDEKKKRLEELEQYDRLLEQYQKEMEDCLNKLEQTSTKLSSARKKQAKTLEKKIAEGLKDLNFLEVSFHIQFKRTETFRRDGYDQVEFLLSANPGEPERPLKEVASGGELSRIMLAIKTVLADTDQIPTLIFDEIDTGISGRTAQMVSEKLNTIGKNHQVICITHLPQIASMADQHYLIEKSVKEGKTITAINHLQKAESITELARLLGGVKITEAVRETAKEMKDLAERTK